MLDPINWNRIDDADKLRNFSTLAATPGVKVGELRRLLGLGSTGDRDIDDEVLNMPTYPPLACKPPGRLERWLRRRRLR